MKQIVGLVGLAFLQLMLGCSSVAPQWRPTAVTDFKSVAGTWQGFLTSDDPKAVHFDRVTLVIDDGGACETTITRTRTTMPVHYDAIDVFAEKTQLVLTDNKLSAIFEKGGHMSAQLYVDPATSERMIRAEGKSSGGFTYSADLKRIGDSASAK
jgi:hypothetical protein